MLGNIGVFEKGVSFFSNFIVLKNFKWKLLQRL